MLEISGKTNLLEQNAYKYSLQDVAEPNLQRDIYTQGMVPKVPFNHRRVPMNMPEEIWITDTSLRDGQQSVEPYTVDQIVNIYKYLSRLGGPYGIIRQTEFFIYSKKDREALEKCMELGLKFPEITTWIRATKEDFRLVRDLGIRETGILVSCSDYHIFKKMKMTRRQAMDYYLATVADAFEAGVVPQVRSSRRSCRAGSNAGSAFSSADCISRILSSCSRASARKKPAPVSCGRPALFAVIFAADRKIPGSRSSRGFGAGDGT